MLRIATFGGVQPAALAELTEVLNNLLDGQNLKRSKMGGVRTAAEIINLMKTQQEEAVITAVREFDGELAQKIIDEMFLFENLVEVDDRSIQRLLQEVDSESLLIALKGAEQPLREKVPAQHVSACGRYPCATTLPTAARFVCLRWKTNRKPFCLLFVVWRKPARW